MTATPRGQAAVEAAVRTLIRGYVPGLDPRRLTDTTPIGSGGAGLDSIATTELLLECEEAFGVRFPPEFLERGRLTVGGLVAAVRPGDALRDRCRTS